jgi:hypothetical protein
MPQMFSFIFVSTVEQLGEINRRSDRNADSHFPLPILLLTNC